MAASNLAFNSQGAVPTNLNVTGFGGQSLAPATTPVQKALNTAQTNPQALVGPLAPKPFVAGSPPVGSTGGYDMAKTPGLVNPNQNYFSQSNSTPTPSTPLKSSSTTDTAGNTSTYTYHAPASDTSGGSTGSSSTPQSQAPQGDQPLTYAGLISLLQKQSSQPSQAYTDAMAKAQEINGELAKSKTNLANELSLNAQNPIPLEFQQGRGQVITNQGLAQQSALSSELAGATNLLGAANSQQGLQQSALSTAAGLSAPSFQGYGAGQYVSPTTGNPVNGNAGQYGSGPAAASNVASIRDFQTQINTIQATAPAADAAFSVLNSYAQGFAGDTPILNGLKQKYGTSVQGSQAVAGFQAQLQAVRQAWQAIEGGDATSAIPDTITPAQLTQIQQQLKTDSQNKVTGLQNQMNTLQGGQTGNGGDIYNF